MTGGFANKQNTGTELTASELLWVQTGTAGVVLLLEQASAPSLTAGYGKLYSKTDNNLYYKDEAGVETQLTGGGSGSSVETPTGTINSVNTVFGVSAVPKWVVSDGMTYFENFGYTYSASNITLEIPPSSYLRAII